MPPLCASAAARGPHVKAQGRVSVVAGSAARLACLHAVWHLASRLAQQLQRHLALLQLAALRHTSSQERGGALSSAGCLGERRTLNARWRRTRIETGAGGGFWAAGSVQECGCLNTNSGEANDAQGRVAAPGRTRPPPDRPAHLEHSDEGLHTARPHHLADVAGVPARAEVHR